MKEDCTIIELIKIPYEYKVPKRYRYTQLTSPNTRDFNSYIVDNWHCSFDSLEEFFNNSIIYPHMADENFEELIIYELGSCYSGVDLIIKYKVPVRYDKRMLIFPFYMPPPLFMHHFGILHILSADDESELIDEISTYLSKINIKHSVIIT